VFVFTELAGSFAQFRAVLRQPLHPQPGAARIG